MNATFVLAIAGAGLIVAGLAPENVDPAGQDWGALVRLVCLNLAMLVLGWSLLSAGAMARPPDVRRRDRGLRRTRPVPVRGERRSISRAG